MPFSIIVLARPLIFPDIFMRVILHVLFTVLVFLLKTEDYIRIIIKLFKKNNIKARKKYMRIAHFLRREFDSLQLNRSPQKPNIARRKRKRLNNISFPSKLKYLTAGIVLSLIFLFLPLVFVIFLQDLPNPAELELRQIPQTTRILDRNGKLLAQIYAQQNRTLIPLSDIPKHLQNATLAIEDKNFYKHSGFDMSSIIRAAITNISGREIQGGSTITQQLIKSSMLTPEKSLLRKFKELILAFWTERIYTKNQILEMYFNQIPYGGTAWGVEAASLTYFDKHAKNLTLAQSAFLAGLTSAPTTYSPYGKNPNRARERQIEVLSKMVALNYITQTQAKEAVKEKLIFKKQYASIHAPHFINYIKDLLSQKYGLPMLEKGGLTIVTSLDLRIQNMAEKIVAREVENNAYLNLTNGASLVTDPKNGDIFAMIGSHDWNDPDDGNFNVVTSLRQPGSTIKVVTYAAALQNGLTPASILEDTPVTFKNYNTPYSPVNYDGEFRGKVTLRSALANSLNIPAVKTLNQIGIPAMVNLAKKMGISTWGDPQNYGLSITLGGAEVNMLDLSTVYGTLANEGSRVLLNPILKITDSKNNILEEKKNLEAIPVLTKEIAFILSDILADNQARVMEFGLNSPLNIPGSFIPVKTGTTDYKKDNWTIGYTQQFVVVVWVGNNDNSPMSPNLASGITGAAPIWHKIMTNLLTIAPADKPKPPPGIFSQRNRKHSRMCANQKLPNR